MDQAFVTPLATSRHRFKNIQESALPCCLIFTPMCRGIPIRQSACNNSCRAFQRNDSVNGAEQKLNRSAFNRSYFRAFRAGFQFSTKFLLILLTVACVFIGIVSQSAINNRRAIDFLTGPEIHGEVLAYRQIWFGGFTPMWIQKSIGLEYFRTPDSVSVTVELDRDGENTSHNGQKIVNSLSRFSRLSKLDFRLRQIDLEPRCYETAKLDFAPLRNLEVDELFVDTNNKFAADVVGHLPSESLNVCGCELNGPLANSVLCNEVLRELRFQKARVTAAMLLMLNNMQSLDSVVFLECRPVINSDGAFDILSDPFPPFPPNKPLPPSGLGPKAIEWMEINLSGVRVVGLGQNKKAVPKKVKIPQPTQPRSY